MWRSGAPEVFVDTMGYAFTLPLFRLIGGCRTGAYVHYPTIRWACSAPFSIPSSSTDMLSVVASGTAAFNNAGRVARSPMLRQLKLIYYRAFAFIYALAGRCCQLTMVNSTWTRDHIAHIWGGAPTIVYPPCDVTGCERSNQAESLVNKSIRLLSIGQFRPEKNHRLQLDVLARLLAEWPTSHARPTLVMAGSCRHEDDRQRVAELRRYTDELGVGEHVDWQLNITYDDLCEQLTCALIGLHTMTNEHFGIGVVELMAAGVITIAHDSGGPRMDILPDGQHCGFRASTADQYADHVRHIVLRMSPSDRGRMRATAMDRARRLFSDDVFDVAFAKCMNTLLS